MLAMVNIRRMFALAACAWFVAGFTPVSAEILYTGFGVDDLYYPSGSRSATGTNRGNPPTDADIGQSFFVPAEQDYLLDSIDVAARSRGGSTLDVWLMGNRVHDGHNEPDESIIDSFRITEPISSAFVGTVLHIESALRPRLLSGQEYWLVFSVPGPNDEIAILTADLSLSTGHRNEFAERFAFTGGRWEVSGIRDAASYAVRVSATAVDEPALPILMGVGMLAMYVNRRRRRA